MNGFFKGMGTAAIMLLLSAVSVCAQSEHSGNGNAIQIAGTDLEHLQSVMDVLKMLPGIRVENNSVTVIGRGKPAIYLDTRKISEFDELTDITADRVKEVEILQHPGVEYDKNVESVIIIRLKPDEVEGFSLDNTLRLDYTDKFAKNNELRLGWRHKTLTLGAFIGWNEEKRQFDRSEFDYRYNDRELISQDKTDSNPEVYKHWFTTRFSAAYDINPKHRITFNYSLIDKNVDDFYQANVPSITKSPDVRHDFALEYSGKLGEWNINVGNNSFINHADMISENHSTNSATYYLRREYALRTFATAFRKINNGSLTFGVEHELDHMNVRLYEDKPEQDPLLKVYLNTHAIHPDNTSGIFATGTKSVGRWTFQAGLRYEYHHYVYTPCEDDGLMKYIDEISGLINENLPEDYYLIYALMKDREVSFSKGYFYPSLSISAKLGGSELSLSHTENSIRPYLGITRLRFSEVELLNEKILMSETASTTTLGWKYKWISLAASYSYYNDPICKTMSSTNQYNAPDYDAVDFDIALTPKFGCWTPMLHTRLHKQWFEMPLANGKDRLLKPFASITFNNSVTLAHDWIIRVNAAWQSSGAERNINHYSANFQLDASIQKTLPRQGLTFTLNAVNVLRSSYNDITRYVKAYYGISQGLRDQNVSMISLSVRYKL